MVIFMVIEFRAKKRNKTAWVYGAYIPAEFSSLNRAWIINKEGSCEVDPKTVGMWSGYSDVSGNKIYDGDIVEFYSYGFANYPLYKDKGLVQHTSDEVSIITYFDGVPFIYYRLIELVEIKIIGNIHDNPDFLDNSPRKDVEYESR